MDIKIYLVGMSSTFKKFIEECGYFENKPRIGRWLTALNSEALAENCELMAVE
jgi:multimeric flavodoxin WrbA